MEGEELGVQLGRMAEHFRCDWPEDDVVNRWWKRFGNEPIGTFEAAVALCMDTGAGFPTPEQFSDFMVSTRRAQTKAAASGRCPHCDNGWVTSTQLEEATASRPSQDDRGRHVGPPESYTFTWPAGMYPCSHCEPERHERWRDQWVPEARRARPVTSKTTFDYNPSAAAAKVRAMLAGATTHTTPPDEEEF